MREPEIITVFTGETIVAGRILSAKNNEICIEITFPFSGIREKTPRFPPCLSHKEKYADHNGELTQFGLVTSKRLLSKIYWNIELFNRESDTIRTLYNSLTSQNTAQDKEETYFILFEYVTAKYHKKISYKIFRELVIRLVKKTDF